MLYKHFPRVFCSKRRLLGLQCSGVSVQCHLTPFWHAPTVTRQLGMGYSTKKGGFSRKGGTLWWTSGSTAPVGGRVSTRGSLWQRPVAMTTTYYYFHHYMQQGLRAKKQRANGRTTAPSLGIAQRMLAKPMQP